MGWLSALGGGAGAAGAGAAGSAGAAAGSGALSSAAMGAGAKAASSAAAAGGANASGGAAAAGGANAAGSGFGSFMSNAMPIIQSAQGSGGGVNPENPLPRRPAPQPPSDSGGYYQAPGLSLQNLPRLAPDDVDPNMYSNRLLAEYARLNQLRYL